MATTNILITGATGQLGHEMRNVLAEDQRFHAIFTDVTGDDITLLDITDEEAVERMVADNAIAIIVNCAAYTAVDAAEDNELLAARLNAEAVGILARAAKRHGARMVHISTDYVFDGNDGLSQVTGTGGRAHLVKHDLQGWFVLAQSEHGLDKILAVGRVEPGGAQDNSIIAQRFKQLALTIEFGASVSRLRIGRHILGIGDAAVTVKNIVGRDVHHAGTVTLGCTGQDAHGFGIETGC